MTDVLGANRPAGPRSLPQVAVTMIVPLRPGVRPSEVRAQLEERARKEADLEDAWRKALREGRVETPPHFARPGNIHFARWVPIAKGDGGLLAYESNVDGEVTTHLTDMATTLAEIVDEAFAFAVGYPEPGARTPATRERFLASILIGYEALHIGHPGIDVATIANDLAVRRELGLILDEDERARGPLRRLGTRAAHDAIVALLRSRRPDLWLGPIEDGVIRKGQIKAFVALGFVFIGLVAAVFGGPRFAPLVVPLLAALLPTALVGYGLYRLVGYVLERALEAAVSREEGKVSTILRRGRPERQGGDGMMERIFASERASGQNALTHLAIPKQGAFRWLLARAVFFAVELVARIEYVNGALGNITSIHFARWMWIDDGKSLLFFSNYDGTWESYLGEFTDKQATWLSAVWSNCEGFPPTEGLFNPKTGAGQEEHFKLWTRDNEHLTPFWYAAYPSLAVRTVLDNALIRASLQEGASSRRIATWMERT